MSEKRRLGDLAIGDHVTIGSEEWEITHHTGDGAVVLKKVGNLFDKSPVAYWYRLSAVKRELEGPYWYGEARDKYGARIVEEMVPDKAYLHQLFSTCFLEFESLDAAKAYYEKGKKEDPFFDIDPVAVIDTSDPEARKKWERHMKRNKR